MAKIRQAEEEEEEEGEEQEAGGGRVEVVEEEEEEVRGKDILKGVAVERMNRKMRCCRKNDYVTRTTTTRITATPQVVKRAVRRKAKRVTTV